MPKSNSKHVMTPGDYELFKLAGNPYNGVGANYFLSYYWTGREFRKWQWYFHHAAQRQITVIGGTGSGKTVGAGLSYAAWAATTPGYSYMNLAPTGWQSKLQYDAILRESLNRPFERFITRYIERPYPMIVLESDYIGESILSFMSAADSAERIQGWEGDSMNLDEGGVLMDGTWLMIMMVTRMRGNVPLPFGGFRKRQRRMSVITANYEFAPPWLWERMDKMYRNPKRFLSMQVKSSDNLEEDELDDMREVIPETQWEVMLEGKKPEGSGVHFSADTVKVCEDWQINNIVQYHLLEKNPPTPGYRVDELPTIGCVHWEMPPDHNRIYMLVGDPGQGNPPHRNAGVIIVWDMSEFPEKPAVLVYFDWVFGNMSYDPWKISYKYAYDTYRPTRAIVDDTGTQKLWTEQVLFDMGMWVEGSDFSGQKKGMLVAAVRQAQRGLFRFPYIQGIRSQLINYDITKDTESNKLPQDITATFMMSSWAHRDAIFASQTEDKKSVEDKAPPIMQSARHFREQIITPRTPADIQRYGRKDVNLEEITQIPGIYR